MSECQYACAVLSPSATRDRSWTQASQGQGLAHGVGWRAEEGGGARMEEGGMRVGTARRDLLVCRAVIHHDVDGDAVLVVVLLVSDIEGLLERMIRGHKEAQRKVFAQLGRHHNAKDEKVPQPCTKGIVPPSKYKR